MALDFLKTGAQIVIFLFIWNFLVARFSSTGDRPGKLASGMAFIHHP